MNLTDLQREAHAIAKDHGWWDEERTFGDLIALVHSELSEALEAYRVNGIDSWLERQYPHSRDTQPLTHLDVPEEGDKPAGVASELADVVIRVADMAEFLEKDLATPLEELGTGDTSQNWSRVLKGFGDWIALCSLFLYDALREGWVNPDRDYWVHALAASVRCVQDTAAHYGIDLDAAIEAKMEYNRTRSYRHGGKAL